MSELKVDKITPRQGTTLTLGDSGDTINFGSGVLPNFENLTVTGDLTVDTNSLKVDSTNNFVGIGTASPSVALDVVGAITATGNITGTLATASQPNITSVGTLTSATVSGDLTVDTNTLFVDASENTVGIGTTSPARKLTINNEGNHLQLTTATTGSTAGNGTDLKVNQTSSDFEILNYESANITAWTNGSERMRIDNSGNVGIGTATLPKTLNINNNSGSGSIGIDGIATSNPQITFKQGGTDKGFVTYWDAYDTLALTDGSANGLHFKPSTLTVGIGTTNPAQILHLRSASPVIRMEDSDNATYNQILSNDGVLSMDTNGTERMRITSAGNVGIGTTSPSRIFQVSAVDSQVSALSSTNTGSSAIHFGDSDDDNVGQVNYQHSDDSMRFTVNASEKVRIDSTGKVGIGTTSPTQLLSVYHATTNVIANFESGDSNVQIRLRDSGTVNGNYIGAINDDIYFQTNGFNERMRIDSSGRVGITTTSPQSTLDIGDAGILSIGTDSGDAFNANAKIRIQASSTSDAYLQIKTGTADQCGILLGDTDDDFLGGMIYYNDINELALSAANSSKLKCNSAGVEVVNDLEVGGTSTFSVADSTSINSAGLYVGTTSNDLNDANDNGAVIIDASGSGFRFRVAGSNTTQSPMYVNRSTADNNNRDLINFYRNGSSPGYIRATNTTVTYQAFCGAHPSQFSDYRRDETIKEGTVMESIDELCSWYMAEFTKPVAEYTDKEGVFHPATTKTARRFITHEGHTLGQSITYTEDGVDYPATVVLETEEEHLPKCKISDTLESKGVYGVFFSNEEDDKEVNGGDMSIASLGAYKVRINANETVQIGDYLQSNGDGTAKVQSDDIFRASTIAKVTSTQVLDNYDDGSYTVPCTLHCG